MSRKIMVGGEEKGDWFDAVISWASPAKAKAKPPAPASPPEPAPRPSTRKPKEEVVKAARAIKTREQLMPTSGPSEPHTVVAPEPPEPPPEPVVEVADTPRTPKRSLGTLHPCGHTAWASPEQDEAARAEGKCCGNWKHMPNWEVRGLYFPVPEGQRRSHEKQRVEWGWPGLCCDPVTGLYIGGVGNDCRYYHNGPERCVVHAAIVSKYAKTPTPAVDLAEPNEPDEPDEEADFMDALTPTPLPTTGKAKNAGGAGGAGGRKGGRRG